MKKMETILANGLTRLTRHVPAVALVILLITAVVGATVAVTNFIHGVNETHRLVEDINNRQLPDLRKEMDRRFDVMDKKFSDKLSEVDKKFSDKFSEADARLQRIELQLNRIITYIETKEGIKPKFP
jgi:hypothetical protein